MASVRNHVRELNSKHTKYFEKKGDVVSPFFMPFIEHEFIGTNPQKRDNSDELSLSVNQNPSVN